MPTMLHSTHSTTSQSVDKREAAIQQTLTALRASAEPQLRRMAETLVDAPDDRLFGDLELTLRDCAHEVAAAAHQAGLEGRKKRAT